MSTAVDTTGIVAELIAATTAGKPAWMALAACDSANPDLFFPIRGESVSLAKAICAGCAVREDCLEYAITYRERFRIWGGLSGRQRRRIRHNRSMARQEDHPMAG
jgi:WhiB family redox-sensing transcriptional regulator